VAEHAYACLGDVPPSSLMHFSWTRPFVAALLPASNSTFFSGAAILTTSCFQVNYWFIGVLTANNIRSRAVLGAAGYRLQTVLPAGLGAGRLRTGPGGPREEPAWIPGRSFVSCSG